MRVLVACEFSGTVRDAFAALGHDAWSCDILPSERPGNHVTGDVIPLLNQHWDLLIGHPPCTYLTNAGVRHLHSVKSRNGVLPKVHGKERWKEMRLGARFFKSLLNAPIRHIAIENPIPHCHAVKEIGQSYTQLIQPWMFGHGETKATCLWLKNLPLLTRTHSRDDLFLPQEPYARIPRLHMLPPSPDRAKERSRTFPGIARAMASQWSHYLCNSPTTNSTSSKSTASSPITASPNPTSHPPTSLKPPSS